MCASRGARASAPSSAGSAHSTKRRRSESPKDTREPFVFRSPGLTPDVRLTVCGQEFHVHSVILKLHSNFFRKFLDSPEKEAAPASLPFKYDYASVIDADGGLGLEPVTATKSMALSSYENSLAKDPDTRVKHIEPFRKLLCSMYTRPYMINNVTELLAITRLADYYCSLPNLSGTISTALLGSPMFKRDPRLNGFDEDDESEHNEFVREVVDVLFAAKKLRHPVLFRECFIHVVATLHDGYFRSVSVPALRQDKDLWPLLIAGKSNLREKIIQAQHAILLASMDGFLATWFQSSLIDAFRYDPECSAGFYRRFLDHHAQTSALSNHEVDHMFAPVAKLMQSNLALDQTGFSPGEGPYEYIFLCAELEDEDMPWDASEFDW